MASRMLRKLFPSARVERHQQVFHKSPNPDVGLVENDLSSRLDQLNREVVSAKVFVKRLENIHSAYVSVAYDLLSCVEQRLAHELLPGSKKWTRAWRDAIGAALKGGNEERARALILYLSLNFDISPKLIRELEAMLPRK